MDADSRMRLIDVARKLFAEKGYEGTSTRDLAKASDLNISMISYYFGSKEGLYKAVLTEFAQQAHAKMKPLFSDLDVEKFDKKNFEKVMHAILSGMLPMKAKNPEISVLLQREMMAGLPYAKEIFDQYFTNMVEQVVSVIALAQKKKIVRPDINPYVLFLSLVHASDSFQNMSQCKTSICDKVPHIPEKIDEYVDQMYKIFIEGAML